MLLTAWKTLSEFTHSVNSLSGIDSVENSFRVYTLCQHQPLPLHPSDACPPKGDEYYIYIYLYLLKININLLRPIWSGCFLFVVGFGRNNPVETGLLHTFIIILYILCIVYIFSLCLRSRSVVQSNRNLMFFVHHEISILSHNCYILT